MDPHGEHIHIDSDAARAADERPLVWRVLVISLLAAIILLSLVWIVPALRSGVLSQQPDVSAAKAQQEKDNANPQVLTNDVPPMVAGPDQRGAMDVTRNQSAAPATGSATSKAS